MHRRLSGDNLTAEDRCGFTCPYLFAYPASPHLSAKMEGVVIDPERLTLYTRKLQASGYDTLLVECAGGLLVPLTEQLLTADYIASMQAPVAVVSSGRLGSINHTLLTFEACLHRGIEVRYLLYNLYPSSDSLIEAETLSYLKQYLHKHWPEAELMQVPQYPWR